MQLDLPKYLEKIVLKMKNNGFEVYLVGGAVRDILMGRPVLDWDLTTNAKPEEVLKIFPDSFYDNKFGTVRIPVKKENQIIEITTYRGEKNYTDRRHPGEVVWGQTIEEDLKRRDFTINAMALDLELRIIDPFGGQEDLKKKIIKAVGDPGERFNEDALRLIRAVRFAAQLDFNIEEKTLLAIQVNAHLIRAVSGERLRDELLKILSIKDPTEGFQILRETELLTEILPELERCFGVEQKSPERHHIYDVGTHSLLSLKFCPSKDPIVRLATLLHDIGKPLVFARNEKGVITFYNHEVSGASLIYNIAQRLHFSKKERERLTTLVRWHQFTTDEFITDAAIRRFIRRVGVENIKDIIDLRIGDRLGSGCTRAESWRLQKFKKRVEQVLHPPFSINDLAIDGNDIMKVLKIKPGPKVGQILQSIFEEVDEDLSKNNREYLFKRIKELAKA